MIKRTKADIIFDTVNYILLTCLVIICVYPVLYVLFCSFSDPLQLLYHRGLLWKPLGFTLDGYKMIFKDNSIIKAFGNTMLYVVVGVGLNMIMTILGAYVWSRKSLLFHAPLVIMITVTMFFGGGLIPWYIIVKGLGMYNNLAAMTIPFAISTWNMIILRTGFQGIPASLEESAYIDGASDMVILLKIILPLSKAVLAVIFLYYLVGAWNSWFPAMVFLRDRDKFPIQSILREILLSSDTKNYMDALGSDLSGNMAVRGLIKYTTIVVATLPIMFVYPFIQRYFVKGVMIGSIKG